MSQLGAPSELFRPAAAGLLCLVLLAAQAWAAELKIEARLIWGTDDVKSSSPKHKLADAATAEKLTKIFKWKNYFEITNQTATVPSRKSVKLTMSKDCEVEITELEGPKVAYRLIGKGTPVNQTVTGLKKGESFVIAGNDKNGCAWFVLITELDEK